MKSRQLANVLIKLLGLSVCLFAIPFAFTGLLSLWLIGAPKTSSVNHIYAEDIGHAFQAVVGIVIITLSDKIAGLMFKNGDE